MTVVSFIITSQEPVAWGKRDILQAREEEWVWRAAGGAWGEDLGGIVRGVDGQWRGWGLYDWWWGKIVVEVSFQ